MTNIISRYFFFSDLWKQGSFRHLNLGRIFQLNVVQQWKKSYSQMVLWMENLKYLS